MDNKEITIEIKPNKKTELIREIQQQTCPYTATGEYLHYMAFLWGIDDDIISKNSDENLRYILLDKILYRDLLKPIKKDRIGFLKQELKKRNAKIKRLETEVENLNRILKNNVVMCKEDVGTGIYTPDKEIKLYFKNFDDIRIFDTFHVRNIYYKGENSYAELVKVRKAE